MFGWIMKSRLSAAINVTAASLATALPASPAATLGAAIAWVCNTGTKDVYIAFGASDGVVTADNGAFVKAGSCRAFALQYSNVGTHILTICGGTDTTTVTVEVGTGDPVPYKI